MLTGKNKTNTTFLVPHLFCFCDQNWKRGKRELLFRWYRISQFILKKKIIISCQIEVSITVSIEFL